MKRIITALFLAALSTASLAHEMKAGDITIEHPWLVQDNTGEDRASGYLKIVNAGEADRLMNAATYDAVSAVLQNTIVDGDSRGYTSLPNGIDIPAGETVEFSPTSYRVFLNDLRRKFAVGETVNIVFTFEKAGPVELEFEVTQ
jgi:periplasmic copper chaperone A